VPQTIRILRGFGQYTKGQIVTIGGGVADVWIRMGRAAPATPAKQSPKIETAAMEPEAEQADRTPRRRRKP
jgi:hypothetical protein